MTPLFMWAGGKTKLIDNHYGPFLPERFDKYHEPFFGGGAMFILGIQANPMQVSILMTLTTILLRYTRPSRTMYQTYKYC